MTRVEQSPVGMSSHPHGVRAWTPHSMGVLLGMEGPKWVP